MNNNTQGMKERLQNEVVGMLHPETCKMTLKFIEKEIALAVSEREKEIVEMLEKEEITLDLNNDNCRNGYNWAIDDVKSFITKPSLSQGEVKEEE